MALKLDIDEADRLFTNADKLVKFIVYQENGITAQNISGWALSWILKRRATDADVAAVVTKTTGGSLTITNGPSGLCELTLTDEDTAAVKAGVYVHELKRTDVGSETPLSEGTVVLRQSKHLT